MSKRFLFLMCSIFLVVPLIFAGCGGSDGATGATGATGTTGATGPTGQNLTETARPESCAICHGATGAEHQAAYDLLYQDNVIRVTNLAYAFNGNNDVVTFNMTKAGANLDCSKVQNLNIYFAPYDNVAAKFQFSPSRDRQSIKATTLVYDGAGGCTSTKASFDNVSLSSKNGFVVVYGFDEQIGSIPSPSRVKQVKYPYAAILKTGVVDYVSAANVAGCEKCHTVPFLKHGNIYGQVNHDAATDFITCKACHLDNGDGGHQLWQTLVDDPVLAAALEAGASLTPEQAAKYAYKTRLMNDVHMSHAMEFEYPQSMANCATCHAGKLGAVLTEANFVAETCKSCHAVTGSDLAEKPQKALQTIWAEKGVAGFHSIGLTCNAGGCHSDAGTLGKRFNQIHTGYDPKIYTSSGTRYSSIFTVTIDNASFNDNTKILTFGFSATESPDVAGAAVTDIKPTVLVGLYGWDSKDYLVGPHLKSIDDNGNGTVGDSGDARDLEYVVGATHPRFTTVSASGGKWVVTANLSAWASKIADGSVKRAEIAVMPTLRVAAIADNQVLALNAPSRTFVIASKTLQAPASDSAGIVKVTAGCNNCHDALGTSFHSGDRGGNIVVCRLCHTTVSGGSHLEMQSRSIDSYVHAIHSFQPFDIQNVDFTDPVDHMFYTLKVESHFPTFGITNCESCHNKGKFNVPDQSKSLAGVLSASRDTLIGLNRQIDSVPSYITGPASRACGSCHRAEWIKEDDAVGLASFNSHTRTNGYLLATPPANIFTEINRVMYNWEDGIVIVTP